MSVTPRRGLAVTHVRPKQRPPFARPRAWLGVAAALALGLQAAPAVATPAAPHPAMGTSSPHDAMVTGVGDVQGYHLYLAAPGNGWSWRPLATIQPGGGEDERWIGQQCLTGDGRTAVAVVAPWSANNTPAGMNAGAYAYAVDVRSGAVRPLAKGVSLAYFDPGCGADAHVALTEYLNDDESATALADVNAATGAVVARASVPGELTSAVVASGQLVAARGRDLVEATGRSVRVLARFRGQLSDLRPASDGGVDLIAADGGGRASVWHWSTQATRRTGGGSAEALRLFEGMSGHNVVSGANSVAAGSDLIQASAPAAGAAAAALSGAAVASPVQAADTALTSPAVAVVTASGEVRHSALPKSPARRVSTLPTQSLTAVASSGVRPAVMTASITPPPSPNTTVPQCAVPRNDIFKQVWQPTSAQLRWAINQAALRALSSTYGVLRPTNDGQYALTDNPYAALPQSYPSADFPLASSPAIPPLVIYGILAQESNWSQASWHAVPGRSGNPLISNYYGTGNSGGYPIDYNSADCGYGVAQITSGMQVAGWPNTTAFPAATQVRVAVDYATNVAAGEQILQQKWQQLQSLGITMNNADPTKVENWYGAIWAYNSGVHYPPVNGQWGLGWANNPINPVYPSTRHTFLHQGTVQTYGDAASPQQWPYQEKVFGWMEVPLMDANHYLDYRGTYDWDTGIGSFLSTPGFSTFCSTTVNNCDPANAASPCRSTDLTTCWWHASAQWVDCTKSCITDSVTNAPNGHVYYDTPGQPEPAATPASVPCSLGTNSGVTDSKGNLITGTVIVDDEMLTATQNPGKRLPNLMGCAANPQLIAPASANASFGLFDEASGVPVDASASPASPAAIDLHQLGGGLGGQMFFTHTGAVGQTEVVGKWTATLSSDATYGTAYEIKVFVPDIAAATDRALYEISGPYYAQRTISQAKYANQWVSLGYYLCPPGATTCSYTVTLRTNTPSSDSSNQGADIGMSALAFVPAQTGAYVALGDSYSSGEGVAGTFGRDATYDDGTDVPDSVGGNGDLCHRSAKSWPRLVAATKGVPIIELACSGSNSVDIAGVHLDAQGQVADYYFKETIKSMTLPAGIVIPWIDFLGDGTLHTPQQTGDCSTNAPCELSPNPDGAGTGYYDELAPQIALLKALRPSLVTMTIGGNDMGFADVVQTCYVRGVLIGGFCQSNDFTLNGKDLLDGRIQSLGAVLKYTYSQVAAAAGGGSKVYVVTYPSILADPSTTNDLCTGLFDSDINWLRPKVGELAGVIKTAAANAGVHAIDISTVFAGHELCTATPYATEPDINAISLGVFDTTSQRDNWYHPNAAGSQAIANAVAPQLP